MSAKHAEGFWPVLVAVAGNLFITVMKFIGWRLTKSGAMFSEAVHSLADTGNQALLLVGIKRSQRPADDDFNYGYGQERFVWALISACGIFFLGAGVTFYHGVHALSVKEVPHFSINSTIILVVSLMIESYSFYVARNDSNKDGYVPLGQIFHKTDPTTLAVLLEDAAALIGTSLALVSGIISHLTGNYLWDALTSICISFLLGALAVKLAMINMHYLIEKAMPADMKSTICSFLVGFPEVNEIDGFKSSLVDLNSYRLYLELVLLENQTQGTLGRYTPREIGKKIDTIKEAVKKRFPQIKYIKIEPKGEMLLGC